MSSDLPRLLRVYLLYHNVGHLFFWDTIRSILFMLSISNVWHIFKATNDPLKSPLTSSHPPCFYLHKPVAWFTEIAKK